MSVGRSGGPDQDYRRWLAAQLGEAGEHPDEHTPTAPLRPVRGASDRPRTWSARAVAPSELDPATEVIDGSLEDDRDPRTVRAHRLPVAFIGESVFDPRTARAADWSAPEGPIDEVPIRSDTPPAAPVQTTRPAFRPAAPLAPPVRAPVGCPPPETDIRAWQVAAAILAGGLAGMLGAVAALWLAS